MIEDYLDDDGYPTEEALKKLEKWDVVDVENAMLFAKDLWSYPERVRIEVRAHPFRDNELMTVICFSTGGWSGNESIIHALNKNFGAQLLWLMSRRGGYHEYEMRKFK